MQNKQCAGCGSQIGARARVCPVCGRGSLVGELGMFAFLGVLLLGIGLASGLIPLDRPTPQPDATRAQVAVPPRLEKGKATHRRQARRPSHPTRGEADRQRHTEARAILAGAPCPDTDTMAVERLLGEKTAADPARLRSVACAASAGYHSPSPDTRSAETPAANLPSAEPMFITPYDSVTR